MWSERASPVQFAGPRRWVRPGIAFEDVPPLDVVLQSHNTTDQSRRPDNSAPARAHPEASWVVPARLAAFVCKRGVRDIGCEELDWWEEHDHRIAPHRGNPAMHFSSRGIGDRGDTLWWRFCASSEGCHGRRVYSRVIRAIIPSSEPSASATVR